METYAEIRARVLKYGIRRIEPPKPPGPTAEVIPLPTGPALAVAKEDRTPAEEISRALKRNQEREIEARAAREARRERQRAEREAEAERQRMEMLRSMNSEASARAAADFNRRMGYYNGNHMNRDGWQGDDW